MLRALRLGSTALFLAAIVVGCAIGALSPAFGGTLAGGIDPSVLLLVTLLLFEVDFGSVRNLRAATRFLSIAWLANCVLIPAIGFGIASLLFGSSPLIFAGVVIYFIAPCTGWYLGFRSLARGDVTLGAALLPINLITQLLLYPLYLWILTRTQTDLDLIDLTGILLQWFVWPLIVAILVKLALRTVLPPAVLAAVRSAVGRTVPFVIAALILQIFVANVGVILGDLATFSLVLVAVGYLGCSSSTILATLYCL